MLRKPSFLIFLIPFIYSLAFTPAFAEIQTVKYLCELGAAFYKLGKYGDALSEFNKVLLLEPDNQTAREYIDIIFQKDASSFIPTEDELGEELVSLAPRYQAEEISVTRISEEKEPAPKEKFYPNREEEINNALDSVSAKRVLSKREQSAQEESLPMAEENAAGQEAPEEKAGVQVSGEVQARLGVTPKDVYWKRANWDLNEKSNRMLSGNALDRYENTYDPRIYDRLSLNLDKSTRAEGFGFHSNMVVDPWSFTGKSKKFTVTSDFGDTADVELKYWGNTGYAVNEIVLSNALGNSFSLPEVKVHNGQVAAFDVNGAFFPNDVFHIPAAEIEFGFQPLRELWLDYEQQDVLKFRLYPVAYENQAITSDDPLVLSNNHIWWEDSPWIRGWKHGRLNSGVASPDFSKGYWDNTWSFFTRDSEGRRLTALRGFSFQFNPQETTSISTSIATPKNLWQDYSEMDNILSAMRIKQDITDNLEAGLTTTSRLGYNVDDSNRLDARNFMLGGDLGYEVIDGIKLNFELAGSQSKYDMTDARFETKTRGNAYYLGLVGRYPLTSIMHTEYGFAGIQPEKEESAFTKLRIFASRMDDSFDPSLSSYVETRDDESWSRHLHFNRPFKDYYQGEGQTLTWDDIKGYRIGNGMDIGRSTIGMRAESTLGVNAVDNLFDLRNVHANDGKFIENVAREELTWDMNDRLTSKLLGIYHRLPKTKGGIDPYIFDTRSRRYFINDQIEDGEDPSVSTGSLGLEYKFFEWLALNGIWEYTNDIAFNYENFPRGILNSGDQSFVYYENGNRYRDVFNFLYGQEFFPQPPYPYYNIFKTGLRVKPAEDLEVYLDYTRNPYKKAGQVDDNMNHLGMQIAYTPIPKLSFFLRYNYSRWQDLDMLIQGITKVYGHHNIFGELTYRRSEEEDFTLQYGESSRDPYMGGVLDIGWDPYGGSLRTIDTQHILRLYYRRKF
jgi:hypothetical protein